MMLLRCTTKVFKKIGGKSRSIEVSTACRYRESHPPIEGGRVRIIVCPATMLT